MPIRFYNSITRKKEIFQPIKDGEVGMYTCGPTVYDYAHIGNFRTFIFEDLLKRYLIHRGYKVYHILNITDIDDKTIKRSKDENTPLGQMTEKFTGYFMNDSKWLKIIPANEYPRATDYIPKMIEMIQILLKRKYAYTMDDGSVYFNIQSYPDYGQLANLELKFQRSTNRVANDEYAKDDPQDFALWKGWKEEDGDVVWDAPWGKGRPGWHIECSAMSNYYLGEHFDIHCGGVDNIFPHHENEIAQSKCATNHKFVNLWMHSEHLMVEKGKMSKSVGNFYQIKDLIDLGYSPENVRYQLLSGHYRTRISFSSNKKHEGDRVINRISDLRSRLIELGAISLANGELPAEYGIFINKLDDDLDAPGAMSIFFQWMRNLNTKFDKGLYNDVDIGKSWEFLCALDSIFGIVKVESTNIPPKIICLADEREEARKLGDWSKADKIRDIVRSKGWIIEDLSVGYKIKNSE
tara:strand:- start:274 stop:1665 length:1392 start_codon:yes stop_codon:yes gene_type:complete